MPEWVRAAWRERVDSHPAAATVRSKRAHPFSAKTNLCGASAHAEKGQDKKHDDDQADDVDDAVHNISFA